MVEWGDVLKFGRLAWNDSIVLQSGYRGTFVERAGWHLRMIQKNNANWPPSVPTLPPQLGLHFSLQNRLSTPAW